jgi:hypothetical protein
MLAKEPKRRPRADHTDLQVPGSGRPARANSRPSSPSPSFSEGVGGSLSRAASHADLRDPASNDSGAHSLGSCDPPNRNLVSFLYSRFGLKLVARSKIPFHSFRSLTVRDLGCFWSEEKPPLFRARLYVYALILLHFFLALAPQMMYR